MEIIVRDCDGCTKCCEGWLTGEAKGIPFYPGVKCHFMSQKGCSIYKDRPHEPCVTYNCQWKKDPNIPEWMKPDVVNAIISPRNVKGVNYFEIIEAGSKLQPEVLNWVIFNLILKRYNVRYQISGGWNNIGSPEFMDLFITNTDTDTVGESK